MRKSLKNKNKTIVIYFFIFSKKHLKQDALRRRSGNVGFLDFKVGIFLVVFWRDFHHGLVEQNEKTAIAI